MNAVALELAGLVTVVLLSIARLLPQGRAMRRARRTWTALGHRKGLSVLLAAVLGFGVSAGASAVRVPAPAVHDEFSYLLAADTYARGRLTNPTHSDWRHFESFHVIHQPSYASKFPPAQGSLLALGIVLGGHPIVGVWIGMGVASGALCWMLQGWLPGRWALFGAVIFALHPTLQFGGMAWGSTYWGGAVPMTGGAMLFGALPRLLRRGRFGHGVVLALGVVALANSRPYEGLVACLAVAGLVLWRLCVGRFSGRHFGWNVALPAFLIACPAAAAMTFYNFRVTGDPLRLPYQVHEATYAAYPLFLWREPPPEPAYRHPVMREFHVRWGLGSYLVQRNLNGWLSTKAHLFAALWYFFSGIALTIPLLAGLWTLGRHDMRIATGILTLALATSALVPWTQPHYLAPTAPMFWLLIAQGWRRLRVGGPCWRKFGRRLALGLFLLYVVLFAAKLVTHWTSEPTGWQWGRQALLEQLTATPGKHLVFVDYAPGHNFLEEWVYNEADLDAAKVVWARIMSAEANRRLMEHAADRQLWIVGADVRPPRLRPVPRD